MQVRGQVLLGGLLSLLAAVGCSTPPTRDVGRNSGTADEAPPFAYQLPHRLDDGWQPGTPEDVGLERAPLERMTEAVRAEEYPNVHAVLIAKDGLAGRGF